MQKNLSKFAGCLLALGFSGVCLAGEGTWQRAMSESLMTVQAPPAKVAEAKPSASPPMQSPRTADWLGAGGNEADTLVTALLGLGMLATVVYRAKT
jgi:hypothetical protein